VHAAIGEAEISNVVDRLHAFARDRIEYPQFNVRMLVQRDESTVIDG
jgi:hypothetical protein